MLFLIGSFFSSPATLSRLSSSSRDQSMVLRKCGICPSQNKKPSRWPGFLMVICFSMTYMATRPGTDVQDRRKWRKPSIARKSVMRRNVSNFGSYCNTTPYFFLGM
jgi:hypothetical protein